MSIAHAALVVIDMQNGFINDRSRHVIPHVVDLVERWQASGGAVVFTRYLNYPGSPFERLIHWSELQGSPQTDIVPALARHADRAVAVVDKKIYSLFTPEGAALVDEAGWRDLVFCGVATESCVLKSAVDAFERDVTPIAGYRCLSQPRRRGCSRSRPARRPTVHRARTTRYVRGDHWQNRSYSQMNGSQQGIANTVFPSGRPGAHSSRVPRARDFARAYDEAVTR